MSMLKPEGSLAVGLGTAALVYAIYSNATPTLADIRVGAQQDEDIASSEKAATWTSVAVVSAVSLIAKDATIFVLGGVSVLAMAWLHRHANTVNPDTGRAADMPTLSQLRGMGDAEVYDIADAG